MQEEEKLATEEDDDDFEFEPMEGNADESLSNLMEEKCGRGEKKETSWEEVFSKVVKVGG